MLSSFLKDLKEKLFSLFNFFIKEEFLLVFLSLLLLFLSFLPLVWAQIVKTPPDSVFTLAFNYVPDYYQYISWMKDGVEGKLFITSRYTLENFSRQPVYFFYSIAGLVSGSLKLNLFFSFHLLRLVLGLGKIYVFWLLLLRLFKSSFKRKLALLLGLFLTPFYSFKPLVLLFPFLTSLDPLVRTFFLPHNSFSLFLILLAFLKLEQVLGSKANFLKKEVLLLGVLFSLAAIANPALAGLMLLVLSLGWVFYSLSFKRRFDKLFKLLVVVLLFTLPVIGYQLYIFNFFEPFAWAFKQQSQTRFALDFKDLLLIGGPGLVFLALGFKKFFKRKGFLNQIVLAWAVLPLLIFPFMGKLVPLSLERLFELCFYLALGIMGGEVVGEFFLQLKRKKVKIVGGVLSLFAFLLFTFPYLGLSLKFWFNMYDYPYFNIFIPKTVVQGLLWMDKYTEKEAGVAAPYYTASFLPAFSHNKVLFGHDFATFKAQEKLKQLDVIYKSHSLVEVRQVLIDNKIEYVVFNQETPRFEQTLLGEVGEFKLVYKNKDLTIYKFID